MMNFFRYARSNRGQALVEFTLAALLFFTLFFAIIEFSHLFYVRSTLIHALREAGRYMVTGRGIAAEDPNARLNAIRAVFEKNLIGTGAGLLEPITLTCVGPCSQLGGGPGQTVTATARFNKPLFIAFFRNFFPAVGGCPEGNACFTLRTTWRNEPSFSS
jgi:Flp pilus assembly protein TadG